MIDRIKALFGAASERAPQYRPDELALAAAVLLVEAARLDGVFDGLERATVEALLRERFGLESGEAATLIAEAESAQAERHQLLPYTRIIKQRFGPAERIQLVEMLWEVVYADDVLHDHEASLLRRIGGLIYVSDRDRGAAKRRVLDRRARLTGRQSK
jgi:uncharacterized tellurite resistance protein B-like protein